MIYAYSGFTMLGYWHLQAQHSFRQIASGWLVTLFQGTLKTAASSHKCGDTLQKNISFAFRRFQMKRPLLFSLCQCSQSLKIVEILTIILEEKKHCPRTHTQQPQFEHFKILTVKNKYTSCTAFVRHVCLHSHPRSQGKLRGLHVRAKFRKLGYRKRPCHCHVHLATYNILNIYILVFVVSLGAVLKL
jgi:hypothetical protein